MVDFYRDDSLKYQNLKRASEVFVFKSNIQNKDIIF